MIKNRTAQLIFYTVYCTIGLVVIYNDISALRWDIYVHFTSISNFLCIGVMFAALIQTARKKEDSYVTVSPLLKFIGMLGILMTFLVFNILLAGAPDRDPQANWRIGSIAFHVVLPIMYVLDWFLFRERKRCKWYYPLLSISLPVGYFVFLLIQAAILGFDTSILIPNTTTPLIYPYFFVNFDTQGVPGVIMWICILAAVFIAVGYAFFGLDRIGKKKKGSEE